MILGDCLEQMREMEENSIDAIVTDPPYGLNFMGKAWDYDVPTTEVWKECLRVLKPGGHLLSFFGTRTYHRGVPNIEDAGFEIRDQLQWIFGSGFPKSLNLKEVLEGFGTALKPANEPIVLARKPLSEKTVAANVLKWGTGGINIDGCRVDGKPRTTHPDGNYDTAKNNIYGKRSGGKLSEPQGRFPANIMFDEAAAEMLDEQSGELRGPGNKKTRTIHTDCNSIFGMGGGEPTVIYDRAGGASRFFYCAKTSSRERNAGLDSMPDKILARSGGAQSALERGEEYDNGDGAFNKTIPCKNNHPTVKPLKLMEYLCKLITPPGGTILDPFMGSGTTGIAAKRLGFKFIGIEKEPEYFEIALKRVENFKENK